MYRRSAKGCTFVLDPENLARLETVPEWSERDDNTVIGEFLGGRAQQWAEALAEGGARPGEYTVVIDPHQRKVHLWQAGSTILTLTL